MQTEKIYRQFLVDEKDRIYQKILWIYECFIREILLNAVSFEIVPSSFIAIICLHQLQKDEKTRYPIASRIIKKDVYLDNTLTVANSRAEAREICRQIINVIKSA